MSIRIMRSIVMLWLWYFFSVAPAYAEGNQQYAEIMSQSGFLSFYSKDGFKVYARLYGPPVLTHALPVVIELHGGPHNNFANTPVYFYKTLVKAGFLVLALNYRGSCGYDADYFNKIVGDLGGGDVEDVVAATKELQRLGFAQENKIFLWGHSYGGFLVYMAISKYPEHFSGGIAMSGPVDIREQLRLLKQNVDSGQVPQSVLDEMQNDLGKDVASVQAPVALVDRVQKPLFIVHGEKDVFCPIAPVKVYASKLKSSHPQLVETWFLDAYGHDLGLFQNTPQAQAVLDRVVDWLQRH